MGRLAIKVMCLESSAGLALPAYQTSSSSGMDVLTAVTNDFPLRPGAVELIPTGLAVAIPEGWEIQVRPRSGLAVRHRVTILNTPATIDSDYRGEIMVPLVNLGNAAFIVERGMRIAQLVLSEVARIEWAEVPDPRPPRRSGIVAYLNRRRRRPPCCCEEAVAKYADRCHRCESQYPRPHLGGH